MKHEGQIIIGEAALKRHITSYYKELFGPPIQNIFTLNETRRDDIIQVSEEENEILVVAFPESEVRHAVFQMKHNKSPGPDGFPAEFYQVFW